MKAQALFQIITWDEAPYQDVSKSQKLAKASVVFKLEGEISGTGKVEYQLFYHEFNVEDPLNSNAEYQGMFFFEGEVNGKKGSFVMIEKGLFHKGEADSSLKIIPNSGTGELEGILGQGDYRASHGTSNLSLDYEL
ncbi:MAG: DUF3224 domain-containing protein [SAR324 cluster bacterium]|nr:DUF3224 domain-containing protein [SAR324 cluster bacterium]